MRGTVLVTGATGFIGQALVPYLAARGWHVRAAARDLARVPSGAHIEPAAMGNLDAALQWRPLVEGATHIVHLAGIAHMSRALPEAKYMEANAAASLALAQAARQGCVRRLVFLSSVRAQTGPSSPRVLSEADTAMPVDAYGRSKLQAECGIASSLANSATDWVALRPVLVYGAGVKGNMALLVRLARSGLPLPLQGLANRRSLVSLDHVCASIAHLLSCEQTLARPLLVADPGAVTLPQILTALRAGLGLPPRLFRVPDGAFRLAARALGPDGLIDRLTGGLEVDTAALTATGFTATSTTKAALQTWMASERRA